MNDFARAAQFGLSTSSLEEVLRDIGAKRYHNKHPLHGKMTSGALSKRQL